MSSNKRIDLDKPRYDQSQYIGRVRHFLDVIDPFTLLTSDSELNKNLQILDDYKKGILNIGDDRLKTEADLWHAKKIKESILHPDTQEPIHPLLRWSAFVPCNVPMVVGMMVHAHSLPLTMFYQWANQSYNVMVNYGNRNASLPMSNEQVAKAYGSAVAVSLGMAAILKNSFAKVDVTRLPVFAGRMLPYMVPYCAVASAGAFNVVLMRWNEQKLGIHVKDEEGNIVGTSRIAGGHALYNSALTRIALPVPVLMAPPLITTILEHYKLMPMNPRLRMAANVGIVAGCLWGALPLSIGLFPQTIETSPEHLEPEFHNLMNSRGERIQKLFFNKGL